MTRTSDQRNFISPKEKLSCHSSRDSTDNKARSVEIEIQM